MSGAGKNAARAMEAVSVEGRWLPCKESKPKHIQVS